MKRLLFLTSVLACLVVWNHSATAHHSTGGYFDTDKQITISGLVTRAEWINPHILLYVEGRNQKNEPEMWVLEGLGATVATRSGVTKERFPHGTHITARAYPPQLNLTLDDRQAVRPTSASGNARIVEGGEVRFDSGEVVVFGRGPKF